MASPVKKFLFGSLEQSTSSAGTLNTTDIKKIARHIVVVAAGAAVTELFNAVSGYLTGHDFGQWQVVVTLVVSSGVLEMIRRWAADHLANVDN